MGCARFHRGRKSEGQNPSVTGRRRGIAVCLSGKVPDLLAFGGVPLVIYWRRAKKPSEETRMNAIADERGYWLVIGLIVLKLILFLAAFAALIRAQRLCRACAAGHSPVHIPCRQGSPAKVLYWLRAACPREVGRRPLWPPPHPLPLSCACRILGDASRPASPSPRCQSFPLG